MQSMQLQRTMLNRMASTLTAKVCEQLEKCETIEEVKRVLDALK